MATYYNLGSTGDDVKRIQSQLNKYGYNLDEDGQYGNLTRAAVVDYQSKNNLDPDGVVGDLTMGSLFKAPSSPAIPNNIVAPTPATPTAPTKPAVDITGLTGLRDYGTGKGLNIGWSTGTGPTVNDSLINTSGLVMKDDKYYGTLDQLNKIFAPYEAPKVYKSPYEDKINLALDKILNYDPSTPYDVTTDPLYAPLKQQYEAAGEKVFQNTIGDLTSMTGGRLNSWATSAASQAKNEYAQDFAGTVLPQLVESAYRKGQDKFNNIAQQLQVLQGIDTAGYGKYRDTVGDYQTDRNYNRGVLESDRNFNYGKEQDTKNFDYKVSRDQVLDKQYMEKFDYEKQQDIINNAFQNRQISVTERNAALSAAKASSGGSGGNSNGDSMSDVMGIESLPAAYKAAIESGNPRQWLVDNALYMDDKLFSAIDTKIGDRPTADRDRILSSISPEQREYYNGMRDIFINGVRDGITEGSVSYKDNPQAALAQLTSSSMNRELLGPAYDLLVSELQAMIDKLEKDPYSNF